MKTPLQVLEMMKRRHETVRSILDGTPCGCEICVAIREIQNSEPLPANMYTERQVIALALGHLAVERPGWYDWLEETSRRYNIVGEFTTFYTMRKESIPPPVDYGSSTVRKIKVT